MADTLSCDRNAAQPLAELVYQPAKGNPFFTRQLLKLFYDDGLIAFDAEVGQWQCDIAQMRSLVLTDDVVDFMALQLQKLSAATQNLLKLAACLGVQFDLKTLAAISQQPIETVAAALGVALQEGLILPANEGHKYFAQTGPHPEAAAQLTSGSNDTYQFLHDRVQQAAYTLISEQERQATHLSLGQFLLASIPKPERDSKIFKIVNQFNIGRSLVHQPSERAQLIELNLAAALKAKASTAYEAALEYLEIGIELLPEESWHSQYDLTRTLYESAAEVAYLNAKYPRMEQLAAIVLSQTDRLIDQTRIYEIKMMAAKAQAQILESIQIGLQVLQLLGVEFPDQPTPADIGHALAQTLQVWTEQSIPGLLNVATMTDEHKLAIMRIASQMTASTYQAMPMLMPLLIFKQINLSIADGNCAISIFSYADYGLILCGVVGNLEAGYQFGQLAFNVLERFQAKAYKCRTYFIVYSYIRHWKDPLRSILPRFLEASQAGVETGDLECRALNLQMYCAYAYFAGQELTALAAEMETYRQCVDGLRQEITLQFLAIYQQAVLNLLGRSENPCQLEGEVFHETHLLPLLLQANNRTALYYLYYNKMVLCYLFGQYQQAAENAAVVESYANSMVGMFAVTLFPFYRALTYLALYPSATDGEQADYLAKVAADQQDLKTWAHSAPMNHLHKFYLVEAERNRVLGNKAGAIEHYDHAISLAKDHEYIHEAALACELAAKFYGSWGKNAIAQSYLTDAYEAYGCWGAQAKVDHLIQSYPQLLAPRLEYATRTPGTAAIATLPTHKPSSSGSMSEVLDLATILKASQSLSGEIELKKLLSTLLQIVIESAGADRCVLLMPKTDQWMIEAISELGQPDTILQTMPIETSPAIPTSLINIVKRTLEPAVIGNIDHHPVLAADPYLQSHFPKSILCAPILNQGKLIGILYLENHLTSEAFTSDRVKLLNLLCSQTAISLENARLYAQEREKSQSLQRISSILQAQKEAELDGIIVIDENHQVVSSNRRFVELWGISEDVLKSQNDQRMWSSILHQLADPEAAITTITDLGDDPNAKLQDELVFKDGRVFERYSSAVTSLDGDYYGRIWCFRDISDRKQFEVQLIHNAQHDTLTGLGNRTLFMEQVKIAQQKSRHSEDFQFALLFIDLDRFKKINDSLGHSVGDQILIKVSQLLQSCLRPNDSLARLGGDEFTILINSLQTHSDAIRVAERINRKLKAPIELDGQTFFVTASIGIVLNSREYLSTEELIRDADIAMYQAKKQGKAGYQLFNQTLYEKAIHQVNLERDMRLAIDRQEFILHYQPIIQLETQQLVGFEALVRWIHPERGLISPADFIPIAEDSRLIESLGEQVLRQACQQFRRWQDQFTAASALNMSVNVSCKQLQSEQFLTILDTIQSETQILGSQLKLEITESLLMENNESILEILGALQDRGIGLSLDDFGTGYSSLSYLHRFPIKTLKIDRSFVSRMESDLQSHEIIRTITTLARTLSMNVVAEGIETAQQLSDLKALQCDLGQGYFFAKPLPVDQATQWIERCGQCVRQTALER